MRPCVEERFCDEWTDLSYRDPQGGHDFFRSFFRLISKELHSCGGTDILLYCRRMISGRNRSMRSVAPSKDGFVRKATVVAPNE